jgi:hypothetical protein
LASILTPAACCCLHEVATAPDFNDSETVFECDIELGLKYHTAGLPLADKELALDLATAKKDQEKAGNLDRAETLRRIPAAATDGAAARSRHERQQRHNARVATSDTEEEDNGGDEKMREREEVAERERARAGRAHADSFSCSYSCPVRVHAEPHLRRHERSGVGHSGWSRRRAARDSGWLRRRARPGRTGRLGLGS